MVRRMRPKVEAIMPLLSNPSSKLDDGYGQTRCTIMMMRPWKTQV